uniref:Uncharacterized protein n=1 Tax=Oryza punctata TaxID=4537 RepID=A0A0E0KJ74_ORYPU
MTFQCSDRSGGPGPWAQPKPINYKILVEINFPSFFFSVSALLLAPVSFSSVLFRIRERRGDEGGDLVGGRRRERGGERPAAAVDGEAVHAAEAVAAGPAHRLRGVPRRRLRRPRRHAPVQGVLVDRYHLLRAVSGEHEEFRE